MPATSISWSVESYSLGSEAALQSAGIWRMHCIFCQMAAGRTTEKFKRPGVKKRNEDEEVFFFLFFFLFSPLCTSRKSGKIENKVEIQFHE